MKSDLILKTAVLLIGIVVVVGVFVGFRVYDNQLEQIDKLQATIKQKDNQIALLDTSNQGLDEEHQENEFEQITDAVNTFIYSIYDVRDDNREERQKDAELVVTKDMMERFFPETEEETTLSMEYRIKDINIYPSVEKESALVVFEGSTVNLNNGQREDNRITVEAFLQNEGEKWIVNDFKQIHAETLGS
ncbi:MerR type regulator [Cytobacillus kochii]